MYFPASISGEARMEIFHKVKNATSKSAGHAVFLFPLHPLPVRNFRVFPHSGSLCRRLGRSRDPKILWVQATDKYFCMNIGLYGAVRMKDGKLLSFDMSIRGSYIKHVLSHSATRFHHCCRDFDNLV